MGNLMLRDALTLMEDKLVPFSIKFCSYDFARNKGGEVISLPAAIQVGADHNRKKNDTVVVKPTDRQAHPYTVHTHLIMEVNNLEVVI